MLLTRRGSRTGKFVMAKPQPWLGDPWHPTAVALVPPGSAGSVNALAFRPPSQGLAVVISAVKFQIQSGLTPAGAVALTVPFVNPGFGYYGTFPSGAGLTTYGGFQLGHALSVSFALAKYINESNADPTTDVAFGAFAGRVPVGTLCDSRNFASDLLPGGYTATGAAPFTAINPISEYRWELPAPLYVPPGYLFLPQFFGLGGNLSGQSQINIGANGIPNLIVQVSYEASILDPNRYGDDGDYTDDVVRIPFAAAYLGTPVSSTVNNAINTYTDNSDETELTNIYDVPTKLTQINGKLISNYLVLNDAAVDAGNSFMVRMIANNNRPLIRDYLAWNTVFDRQTRAWPLEGLSAPYELAPGEAVLASVTGAQNTTYLGASPFGMQPVIVMSGYREVPLSSF